MPPTTGSRRRLHRLQDLDAGHHADLLHHLLGRARHAEVAVFDGVGDSGGHRRRRGAHADPRQRQRREDQQIAYWSCRSVRARSSTRR